MMVKFFPNLVSVAAHDDVVEPAGDMQPRFAGQHS